MTSKIYILCSDTDQPFEKEILGWSEDKSFLDSEAERLEWADYRAKWSMPDISWRDQKSKAIILSPAQTDYRKYSVEPVSEYTMMRKLSCDNDLKDGYYWYFPKGDEKHDDLTGDVKMVEVWNSGLTISTPGNGEALHITEATGEFVGPLIPPKQ